MGSKRKALLLASAAGGLVLALVGWGGFSYFHRSARTSSTTLRSTDLPGTSTPATSQSVRVTTEFEGAYRMPIKKAGPDHYTIPLTKQLTNWWGMKVEGAAGRTLKFTFTDVPTKFWSAMRPVYAYGKSLSEPALFEADDRGQSRWGFVDSIAVDSAKSITFTHKFTENAAFIALRVPYTLGYQEKYLAALSKQPGVEVITIGRTAKQLPLTLIKIGRGDEQSEKENPCILMYAREHCDEPDPSWVVQGALRCLLADTSETRYLREHFTFLFIPMLDPDGFLAGRHEGICDHFRAPAELDDVITYARWAKQWFDSGRRLDLVFNLHNPEPRDYLHVLCPRVERGIDRSKWSRTALAQVISQLNAEKIANRPYPISVGLSPGRMGNYLSLCYGPIHLPFEINTQCSDRRLSLEETRGLGRSFVVAAQRFFNAPESQDLFREIQAIRLRRRALPQLDVNERQQNLVLAELRYSRESDEPPLQMPRTEDLDANGQLVSDFAPSLTASGRAREATP
jgi:hypothetical protein